MDENFLMAETSIIVIAHAVTMSAGIVDNDEVAHFDFRKLSLDGEFIAVLTKGAGHVIDVVLRCICFAEDGDVVVPVQEEQRPLPQHDERGVDELGDLEYVVLF